MPVIPQGKIALGRITKPHGTAGEMVVHCFSEQPESLQHYKEFILLAKDGRVSVPLPVSSCRLQGKKAIVGFAGITSRQQLDALMGAMILVEKEALPTLDKDHFYWCNYIGRTVATKDGEQLGVVKTIFNNGAQDILVLRQRNEEEEILIPVTRETLVDDRQEALIVDLPLGLLEINSSSETKDEI